MQTALGASSLSLVKMTAVMDLHVPTVPHLCLWLFAQANDPVITTSSVVLGAYVYLMLYFVEHDSEEMSPVSQIRRESTEHCFIILSPGMRSRLCR